MDSGDALRIAAIGGDLNTVQTILETNHVFLNAINSALEFASFHGHFEIVQFLLQKGLSGLSAYCCIVALLR